MKQLKIFGACVALSLSAIGAASGAENGTTNYPAGSPGVFVAAFPPIPGLFAVSQTNYTSLNGLYDGNGNKTAIPFKASAISETLRILASYPGDFLGAHVYSQLVVPTVHIESTNPGGSFKTDGIANITFSPVILTWSVAPFQTLTAGIDLMLNTGTYSRTSPLNVGSNYNTFSPVFAYRYADPKGFEFAVSPRLLLNTANNDSANPFNGGVQSYRSGDAFVTDFSAQYNIGPWKFGAVGGYTYQYTNDTFDGIKAFNVAGLQDGNRLRSFNVGPSLTYAAGPVLINLNYQRTISVSNGAKADSFWANVAFPLWVPAPPSGARLPPR